jgi:hypothetical protein
VRIFQKENEKESEINQLGRKGKGWKKKEKSVSFQKDFF